MNVIEAMEARHSVRSYQNKPIEEEKRKALEELARKCNAESGLNIQLCFDEEEAFRPIMESFTMSATILRWWAKRTTGWMRPAGIMANSWS